MRAVVTLATLLLASCSSLLGIQDPSPAHDAGLSTDGYDSGDGLPDHLMFSFGDFQLPRAQTARVHVLLVPMDSTIQDVTATASYATDDSAIAAVTAPGQVSSGSRPGTTTIRASLGSAAPAAITVTVVDALCLPVINEFATGSARSPADEWVEIYNPCMDAVDVNTWTLVYRAASTTTGGDNNLMATLTGTMSPGEIRLFAGPAYLGASDGMWTTPSTGIMKQDSGALGLRAGPQDTGANDGGVLIDSVTYGAVDRTHPFTETNPTATMANGLSASRMPFDGNDDDDAAADFKVSATMTPRALNAP